MEGYEFETKEEALKELNKLTGEFLNLPTPYEFQTLSKEEQVKYGEEIKIVGAKIREISDYIKEKWGK